MSDFTAPDLEGLLRQALHPVDPPAELSARLDATLQNLTDLAHEELEAWELSAMKDPRNWGTAARPIAAVAVGGAAGTALVLLRVRAGQRKRRQQAANPLDLAARTAEAVADEARKLLDR